MGYVKFTFHNYAKIIITLNIDTLKKVLVGFLLSSMGLVVAQDQPEPSDLYQGEAFYLRVGGERPPSYAQVEALSESARQSLTAEDRKTLTYHDLKYFFREHTWISIGISFYGYFDKKVLENYVIVDQKLLEEKLSSLLSTLPPGSYRRVYEPLAIPNISFDITEAAADSLYKNNKINSWFIDQEVISFD